MKRSIGLHHRLQANTTHEPGLHLRHHPPLDLQTAHFATVAAFGLHELPLDDQHGLDRAPPALNAAPTPVPATAGMNRGVTVK